MPPEKIVALTGLLHVWFYHVNKHLHHLKYINCHQKKLSPKAYSESFYQEQYAKKLGGRKEVTMPDGTRCDILTDTHAIEVDSADKWAEAIGQSLNYAMQTGKKAGIVLVLKDRGDEKH